MTPFRKTKQNKKLSIKQTKNNNKKPLFLTEDSKALNLIQKMGEINHA